MCAAACIGRRCVRTGARESAVEVNGGDYGFFEGHPIFRAFFFALLLQRAAQNLSFDAATDGGSGLSDVVVSGFGNDRRSASLLVDKVITENQIFGRAVHFASGSQ